MQVYRITDNKIKPPRTISAKHQISATIVLMKYKALTSLSIMLLATTATAGTPSQRLLASSHQPFAYQTQDKVSRCRSALGKCAAKQMQIKKTGVAISSKPKLNWMFALGLSATYLPRYLGSNHSRMLPLPIIDIFYKQRLFFSSEEGLGVNVYNKGQDKFGVALGYDLGRKERSDKKNLHGLGNIPAYATANVFGQYAWHHIMFRSKTLASLQTRHGLTAEINVGYNAKITPKLNVTVGPSLMWASENYMNSYFSVNQKQSRQSGLKRYSAHAGLLDGGAGFNVLYSIAPEFMITAYGGATYLFKHAGQSPVVRRRWQTAAGIGGMLLF